jgi:benzoyl-CoA reductase subunit B
MVRPCRIRMKVRQMERFKRDRDLLRLGLEAMESGASPEKDLTVRLGRAILRNYDEVIDCAENGRPFIASSYGNAPELFAALGLPWYTLAALPFLPMSEPDLITEIDEAERLGLGTDMCTVVRLGIRYVYAGYVPPPTAFVGLLCPCDAANVLHQSVARQPQWRNVPAFCTDPPYVKDERGTEFFAGELRRMVAFLEEHTAASLNLNRLRETVVESNRQYELWAEFNRLKRAVPCPPGAGKGGQAWHVAQNYLVGDPAGTEWFRQLVDLMERGIKEGKSEVPNERIRLFWFDIRPVWLGELTQWLKQEWGACIVMDMLGCAPYTPIDTSSEESILRGLARRHFCDVPMIRQVHGSAEAYARDIEKVIRDYKIDCFIWPGHMGHKDLAAGVGIMREVCAGLGVPFLELGLDLLDRRYTPVEDVKAKIGRFFEAMGLG